MVVVYNSHEVLYGSCMNHPSDLSLLDISIIHLPIHSLITARNEVGARLCFYMCLWFCSQRGSVPLHAGIETPTRPEAGPTQDQAPQCNACWEIRGNKQSVRILLECILVYLFIYSFIICYSPQTKFAKVMFYTCLSFCPQGGVSIQEGSASRTGVCIQKGGSVSRGSLNPREVVLNPGGVGSESGGICIWRSLHPEGVWGRPPHRILRDTVNERAVRILLECILISSSFHFFPWSWTEYYCLPHSNHFIHSIFHSFLPVLALGTERHGRRSVSRSWTEHHRLPHTDDPTAEETRRKHRLKRCSHGAKAKAKTDV